MTTGSNSALPPRLAGVNESVKLGEDILNRRALAAIEGGNTLGVFDHLRPFGSEILTQGADHYPGARAIDDQCHPIECFHKRSGKPERDMRLIGTR
jgi:hypothetical protein